MKERLFMAAHSMTRLNISHGVRATSRLDGMNLGMYRGVAFFAKEKLIDFERDGHEHDGIRLWKY